MWVLPPQPPPPFQRRGSISRRAQGVDLAVLPSFAALLHQPGGGFLDAPAPINRQQAEGEIRPADVGPVAFACRRGILHASRIARPAFAAIVARNTGGGVSLAFRGSH